MNKERGRRVSLDLRARLVGHRKDLHVEMEQRSLIMQFEQFVRDSDFGDIKVLSDADFKLNVISSLQTLLPQGAVTKANARCLILNNIQTKRKKIITMKGEAFTPPSWNLSGWQSFMNDAEQIASKERIRSLIAADVQNPDLRKWFRSQGWQQTSGALITEMSSNYNFYKPILVDRQ